MRVLASPLFCHLLRCSIVSFRVILLSNRFNLFTDLPWAAAGTSSGRFLADSRTDLPWWTINLWRNLRCRSCWADAEFTSFWGFWLPHSAYLCESRSVRWWSNSFDSPIASIANSFITEIRTEVVRNYFTDSTSGDLRGFVETNFGKIFRISGIRMCWSFPGSSRVRTWHSCWIHCDVDWIFEARTVANSCEIVRKFLVHAITRRSCKSRIV